MIEFKRAHRASFTVCVCTNLSLNGVLERFTHKCGIHQSFPFTNLFVQSKNYLRAQGVRGPAVWVITITSNSAATYTAGTNDK